MNSAHFVESYNQINPTENNNNSNQLVNSHKERIREEYKEEEVFDDAVDNEIPEEQVEKIRPDTYHNFP